MEDDGRGGGRIAGKAAKDAREARLKLALRENLKRRKSQARGRENYKSDFVSPSSASDEVVRANDEESPG
jgi:hypothetical protein